MSKITDQEKSPKSKIYSKFDNDDYKKCPYCKQNKIPFKLGVCICGEQVEAIQHVQNTKQFVISYYSYEDRLNLLLHCRNLE